MKNISLPNHIATNWNILPSEVVMVDETKAESQRSMNTLDRNHGDDKFTVFNRG